MMASPSKTSPSPECSKQLNTIFFYGKGHNSLRYSFLKLKIKILPTHQAAHLNDDYRLAGSVRLPHHSPLLPAGPRHLPPQSPPHRQGGQGVRESRHLPTGPS